MITKTGQGEMKMMDTDETVTKLIEDGVGRHIAELDKIRNTYKSNKNLKNLTQEDFDEVYANFIRLQAKKRQLTLDTYLREKFLGFVEDLTPELIVYC